MALKPTCLILEPPVHKVEGFSSGAATIHADVDESAGLGNEKAQID